jgi:DNA-binding transcriptional ArsR family regulator
MAGTMRRRGFDEAAILAALRVTNERCDPPLPEDQVAKIARSVGRYAPDPLAASTIRGISALPPPVAVVPTPPIRLWSHDALLDHEFPPLEWLVKDLVPDGGLTILGGKKKLGKSWLCLQVSQAVAQGQETLGKPCSLGGVVYICLEDGGRRLQNRLRKQGSPRGLPITWYTSFPKLDGEEGMKELAKVAEARPRLLVVDTLAAAKSGRTDENASGPMADLANGLRELAQHYGVGVLVTHHHGKASYGDPGDDLRGSSALAAAADVNLGMYKTEDGFRLRGEGRDIEPCDYAIRFDAFGNWKWEMIGDARALAKDEADQELLLALAHLKEAQAESLAEFVNKDVSTVRARLKGLLGAGKVATREARTGGRGRPFVLYRLPEVEEAAMAESPF